MSLAKILKKILDEGFITGSKIPKSAQSSVDHLVSINALEQNILKRGSRYKIGNLKIFQAEISSRYPNGLESAINFEIDSSRHLGVKSLKDAKLSRKKYPTVQVSIKDPSKVTIKGKNAPNGIEDFSLSVLVDSLCQWNVEGKVVLIENQEPYLRSSSIFKDESAIICYNGRVNDKISKWINESELEVIICPDYDPVGLDEYWKLKSKIGPRVNIFLPESISEDFKYSTPALLDKKKNREVLRRLANTKNLDTNASHILSLIQKWNAGLMQEIYFSD